MATLNVDPEKQSDPYYRYKMARVQTKVEGNGNGIKTVICNITDISGQLARNVEHLMKFFAHVLAATQKFKDEKWILTGNFAQDIIQKCIFDFISKFVLCKKCRNPETVIQIDHQKDCFLNCKACSQVTPIAMTEKLCKEFVKDFKEVAVDKKKKGPKEKSKDEKEEEKFNKLTRKAGEEEIVEEAPGDLPNPVEVLREFLATSPSDREYEGKVFDLKGEYGLSDKAVIYLVFEALFDEKILEQIPVSSDKMRRFLKPEIEKELVTNVMALFIDKNLEDKDFKRVLKGFYDTDCLSKEAIIAWHEGKLVKNVKKEAQQRFKDSCEIFIKWLREQDEEEDEEEAD